MQNFKTKETKDARAQMGSRLQFFKFTLFVVLSVLLISLPGSSVTRGADSATVTVTITFRSPEKATVSESALEQFTSESWSEGSRTEGELTSLTLRRLTDNSGGTALVGGSGDKQQANQDEGQNQGTQDDSVRVYYDDSI